MKTILKLSCVFALALSVMASVSANAKNGSSATSSQIKVKQLISPYFRAPMYASGDYWGVQVGIIYNGGTSYEGRAACGIFNNDVLVIPIVPLPSDLTVTAYITSSVYTGYISATIPAGSNSATWIDFDSTTKPTLTSVSWTPSTLGAAPNNNVQLESIFYQNYTP